MLDTIDIHLFKMNTTGWLLLDQQTYLHVLLLYQILRELVSFALIHYTLCLYDLNLYKYTYCTGIIPMGQLMTPHSILVCMSSY